MERRPTVYDVAERAGVSIATVSFAFRQPERVRAATRATVLTAARELGYVPSANARGLARGSTGAFGMYSFDLMLAESDRIPRDPLAGHGDADTTDPRLFPLYVDEVERGFALECRASGRALLLASGAPSGAAVYDIAGRVDGLAVFPGPHRPDALRTIAQRIPVVAFNTAVDDGPLSHVTVDNRAGIARLVEHLATVHQVTDLAYAGDLSMPDFHERHIGFREAVARYAPDAPASPADREGLAGEQWLSAMTDLIATDRLPQALVCQNDQFALDVLDLLAAHDIAVPGRVLVTGFDGILAGRLSQPTLTTIRQPLEAMGRLAMRVLAQQLETPGTPPENHVLPLRAVYRGSCGCSE